MTRAMAASMLTHIGGSRDDPTEVAVPNLTVNSASPTPVYRQIVEQIRYMIESGELTESERLPPARLLAENLGVNRNTVAKAYATLRDMNLIRTHGAAGTIVTATGIVDAQVSNRDLGRDLLAQPVRKAVEIGLTAEEISTIALTLALQVSSEQLKVLFAECNEERARSFAQQLSERLQVNVRPCILVDLPNNASDLDLLITTFFHLAEVRKWARESGQRVETAAVVVAPHIQTLMKIAAVPKNYRVAVHYSTEHQAEQVRDWLADAGTTDVTVIPCLSREIPNGIDVLIVPTEQPDLAHGAGPHTQVIEFGNVLDDGSVRMIAEMLADIRQRSVTSKTHRNQHRNFTHRSA